MPYFRPSSGINYVAPANNFSLTRLQLMKPHRRLKFAVIALLVATPAIAWAAFKPIQILVPTLNGVTCIAQPLQLDAVAAVGRILFSFR